MANQQDVEQISLGVEAWNAWRQAQPERCAGLSRADLLGVDLGQGNLSRAISPGRDSAAKTSPRLICARPS